MFSLSKRVRLGLSVLVTLARAAETRTGEELAQELDASPNHLAKVLQALARKGWIEGTRGAKGGYRMTEDPHRVSMADVVTLFEGPWRDLPSGNGPSPGLSIDSILQEIDEQAYYTLESVTIRLLAHPVTPVLPTLTAPEADRGVG